MAEFGWAYIEGGALTGSGGEHGSIQFKTPGGLDGSKDFIYDTGSGRVAIGVDWPNLDGKTVPNAMLHVNGDVSVTGTIYASQYQIAEVTSIQSSGDSRFGDSSGDIHEFTGSVKVKGSITATGDLTASMGILIPDSENATDPTAATVGFHVGTGGDLNIYHNGTDSYIFNQTGDLKIESTVNSAESILIHANGGAAESIMVHADQGTTAKSVELKTDAGGILFNLDATSGKKLHVDVESTDLDAIHLDSEGGIKLESDAEPVYITGGLLVSGSSIILCNDADTDTIDVKGVLTASADVIVADDKKIYFGTGKDASFEYDEDGTDTLLYAGASIRISDDTKIEFGTGGDATIEYDENGTDELRFAGAAVTFEQAVTFDGNMTLGNADTDVITLTGRMTASAGLLISDADDQAQSLQIGTGGDLYFAHDGTDSVISNGTGKLKIQSSVNASDAIRIRANGGTSETIFIRADQGTSVMTDGNSDASIQLKSDDGGIGIRSTANLAGSIQIEADGGANETIIVKADQSTVDGAAAAGSIQLLSDAGGIGLSWNDAKDLWAEGGRAIVTANENAADCIKLHADAGTSQTITIVNDAGTSATEGSAAIQLLSSAGGVNIKSGLNAANAILLTADGGTSETIVVHSDQGTGAASIGLTSDAGGITLSAGTVISGSAAAGINLTSTQNGADSIYIRANGGTSEIIKIHADQGTDSDSIHLLSDAGGITLQVGSGKLVTVNGGDLVPSADNTLDLGAADKRWQNIYTGDLHLKNDRGDWTIVEESDYLSLRNNNTGKLYKFVMEEVTEE